MCKPAECPLWVESGHWGGYHSTHLSEGIDRMQQWLFLLLALMAVVVAAVGVIAFFRLWKRHQWDAIKTDASEERMRANRRHPN
jgi:hypothetical protein